LSTTTLVSGLVQAATIGTDANERLLFSSRRINAPSQLFLRSIERHEACVPIID
jgi:hypothetical protein